MKLILIFITITLLLLPPTISAHSHYTFEHAEEMRLSGRVNWREYGPAAFEEAIRDNKPIFLMLTAPTWCYWCHVYTSDEYVYHPGIYPTINDHFVPIYVDADKRQDLTRQYLEGGWPSTTVFTPGRERLFGYSGPRPLEFMDANLRGAIDHVNSAGFANTELYSYTKKSPVIPTTQHMQNLLGGYTQVILQSFDPEHGGFGQGQKFPQGRTLDFSLDVYELTNNPQFLTLVTTTLENQYTKKEEIETNYNLFDPIEGGFHRYGVQRDWTPPHYEKMLYDNARLLKAYAHLRELTPDDPLVNEVVDKTLEFIETQWYDKERGGFYGNSDVHGEHHYYGFVERAQEKPRVEKTKYTNWNAEAILTYLYLWEVTENEKYKQMAEQTLDFFSEEMISDHGAYHFIDPQGTKAVRGTILDNAYLLLALVEGYETLGKKEYLEKAEVIAAYSLNNLYDWNSGGFFERNSPDKHLYAPGEHLVLSKPLEENGIMSYALLKLYIQTSNPLYLNSGIKTFGEKMEEIGGLDRGYYYLKAAQFVIEHNLLDIYNENEEIPEQDQEKQESFWLTDVLERKKPDLSGFVVSEKGLETFQGPLFLLGIIALLAGFISFASPCSLPIVPAYIAYSFRSSKQNIKAMTLFFFLGLSVVFTVLGMSATLVGEILRTQTTLFSQIAGALLILFGVLMIAGKGFTGFKIKQKKPTTYAGSFLFGSTLGLSWTPCVGPILVGILLLASTTSSVLTGGLLLFLYSIGLALPLILLSLYVEKINKESRIWKLIEGKEWTRTWRGKHMRFHSSSVVSGILFLLLGVLIFSGLLFSFNQFVAATEFQKFIFGFEEQLLNLVR